MGALEAFAVGNGFPEGWAGDMLADGAVAVLAMQDSDGGEAAVGMGWFTPRSFFVEEVAATLDPNGGAYLFGDFVAPAHRGRGIQRWLVAERLRAVNDACTLVHPSNLASLKSYEREGFRLVGEFIRYRWARRTWARCTEADYDAVMDIGGFGWTENDTLRAWWI